MNATPNAELVAKAWLVSVAKVLPAGSVAATLPARDKWADNLFLVASALQGGAGNVDVPQRRSSFIALDCYAATKNTPKPMWRTAFDVLEQVREATFEPTSPFPTSMLLPDYDPARILGVWLSTEPARVSNDPSGYAHVTATLAIDWTA